MCNAGPVTSIRRDLGRWVHGLGSWPLLRRKCLEARHRITVICCLGRKLYPALNAHTPIIRVTRCHGQSGSLLRSTLEFRKTEVLVPMCYPYSRLVSHDKGDRVLCMELATLGRMTRHRTPDAATYLLL